MSTGFSRLPEPGTPHLDGETKLCTRVRAGNGFGPTRQDEGRPADLSRDVAGHHPHEPDLLRKTRLMASWSEAIVVDPLPLVARFQERQKREP